MRPLSHPQGHSSL